MAEKKEIASIEILHLDETGYGPEGKHTRREWRAECLTNLLAGKDQFLAWQEGWKALAEQNDRKVSFGLGICYKDGTSLHYADSTVLFGRISHALDFCSSYFEVALDCDHFHFQSNSLFDFSQFSGHVKFRSSKFSSDVNFYSSQFLDDVDFSASQFSGNAYFIDSQFLGDANFRTACFSRVDFSSSHFSSCADFMESQFSAGVDFIKSQFSRDAHFLDSKFTSYAHFMGSHFLGTVDFIGCEFLGEANFRSAKFLEVAYFRSSQFTSYAFFGKSQFMGDADFYAAKFSDIVDFRASVFGSRSDFSHTFFKQIASFENASFANVGHFEQARFEQEIPTFRGCKIDATRLEFSDESHFTQADYSEDAIKNISFLKRLSDQHGQVDQAIEFNAMELRAKRQYRLARLNELPIFERFKSGDWWATHATWVYEHVSDFGRSFTKPLKGYLALLGVTWLLALVCAIGYAPQLCSGERSGFFAIELARYNTCENPNVARPPKQLVFTGYTAASEYTLYRASGFIHFADKGKQVHDINRRLFNSPVEPWFMLLWGLVTSLLSTIFFFFIVLGLRNRYRIK